MSRKHAFLHYTRSTHLYLGVFIAPALLFFAFTGALQTFSLHETTRGSSYRPPAWIATLAQIHKKQTMTVPVKKVPPSALQAPGPKVDKSDKIASPDKADKSLPSATLAKPHKPLPLKLFFLLVSIGLFVSTLSGLYMSYRYSRNRPLITALLLAGVILPIALLFL
jgi:hypothetical protein